MVPLMTVGFWLSLASASPTINLPSVADQDDGTTVYVGSGAAILGLGPLPSARISGEWQSSRLGFQASSTAYFGTSVERFDVVGGAWAWVNNERVRLGPALTLAQHTGTSAIDHRVTGRMGLSVDAGGERTRFDATISMSGFGWYPRGDVETPFYRLPIFDTLLVTEMGIRRSWGSHQARLGLFGPMLALGYQWSQESWRFRIDGTTRGTQHGLWVQVGRHFGRKA